MSLNEDGFFIHKNKNDSISISEEEYIGKEAYKIKHSIEENLKKKGRNLSSYHSKLEFNIDLKNFLKRNNDWEEA